jgi:hypothetical protein
VVINDNGAFFNSGVKTDQGKISGGTVKAGIFILLRELGHLLGAPNFQSDRNSNQAGASNDSLVEQNCAATLAIYK